MAYEFDFVTALDRKGHDSSAADYEPAYLREGFDFIPMAVADMGFKTCPAIVESIKERLEHPIFGYFPHKEEYYDVIVKWQERKHGVTGLKKENIMYHHGVHGGNVHALRLFCHAGDKIMIHTPIYASFRRNIKDLGWNAVESELVIDENGVYRMDFEDMEKEFKAGCRTLLFCSPHNPLGRVWEKWELEKMMELCEKYEVKVVSDEIWADFVFSGHKHVPVQSVSEYAKMNTIALYAPSKTFNLAGMMGSYSICYNPYLQARFARQSYLTMYNKMTLPSMYALLGAYSDEGFEWAKQLIATIEGNAKYAVDYIRKNFEGVTVGDPEGTYVIFVDTKEWCEKHGKTHDELFVQAMSYGVGWQDGVGFKGNTHFRINLAQPRHRVEEAMDRLNKYVFNGQW